MELLIGIVIGAIVMDFLWAYKLGMVQVLYARIKEWLTRS